MRAIITLMTDFGTRDPYAAAMKGVCLTICPDANVVDLSHEIAHHDVLEGALFLGACAADFPNGTIHCVVVDPGVGTSRNAIVVETNGQIVVCPDNGLLTRLHQRFGIDRAVQIEHPDCFSPLVSNTFHGRDIFAVTAARIAAGMPLDEIGPLADKPVLLSLAKPRVYPGESIHGEVIHVDRFGNLITNVERAMLDNLNLGRVTIGDLSLDHVSTTYGDVSRGEPLALIGGSGLLEIAINCGSAADRLGLGRSERVRISV